MAISFTCDSCGVGLGADESFAGRTIICPHCGGFAEVTVPKPKEPFLRPLLGPFSAWLMAIDPRTRRDCLVAASVVLGAFLVFAAVRSSGRPTNAVASASAFASPLAADAPAPASQDHPPRAADPLDGFPFLVVGAPEPDEITVQRGADVERVHILGVAPDADQDSQGARDAILAMTAGRRVRLEPDPAAPKGDGPPAYYIHVQPDSMDLGRELIRAGVVLDDTVRIYARASLYSTDRSGASRRRNVRTAARAVARTTPPPTSPPSYSGGYSAGTTPTGLPLHVGPRGGVYHYSKNGNKVYESSRKPRSSSSRRRR